MMKLSSTITKVATGLDALVAFLNKHEAFFETTGVNYISVNSLEEPRINFLSQEGAAFALEFGNEGWIEDRGDLSKVVEGVRLSTWRVKTESAPVSCSLV